MCEVGKGLGDWFAHAKKSRGQSIRELEKQLRYLNSLNPFDDVLGDIVDTKLAINCEVNKEEIYWAHANWMRHCDCNTNFFRKAASERRRRNFVERLIDSDSTICDSVDSLLDLSTGYFDKLFLSNGISNENIVLEGG